MVRYPIAVRADARRAAFVAALTPSMISRPGLLQGVECGLAFALLYGLGTGASALWSWLQLPVAGPSYRRKVGWISILLCVALVGYGLVREPDWQNAIRRAMGMPPVATTLPFLIAIVSAPVALFLIGIAKFFIALAMFLCSFGQDRPSSHCASQRLRHRGGAVLVDRQRPLAENGPSRTDSSYRRIDALLPTELSAPVDP